MSRRLPMPLMLLGMVVMLLGLLAIGMITGYFAIGDLLTDFYTFVFALVVISILSIIGATFLGIYISHRFFSKREFSAFEEEMLKVRDDIKYIKNKLEDMSEESDK